MPGVMPDRYWKERNIGYHWVHGDTIISGIGQGFILTNCLQLTVMMARTASNKTVIPRLIDDGTKPKFDNLGLQQKNIKFVQQGLEEVLKKGGTAAGSAVNINGKRMGGKTGTSQVRSISKKERESGVLTNEQLKWSMRNHGLFVGYAPTNKPKYAICVITEHAGSSTPAAKKKTPNPKIIFINCDNAKGRQLPAPAEYKTTIEIVKTIHIGTNNPHEKRPSFSGNVIIFALDTRVCLVILF
jgi:penicillin-binding protein 2